MAIPRSYLSLLFLITETEEVKTCPHPNIYMTTRPISHLEYHMHDAKMEETFGGWKCSDIVTISKLQFLPPGLCDLLAFCF